MQLSSEQDALRFAGPYQSTKLANIFTKEYLVIDMSLAWCKDCINFAVQKNLDTDFQSRVS